MFHALLPVRDEADVIGTSLRHLLTWADAIYVLDTGSVDETWDIVQDLASKEKRVVPMKKDAVYFNDTVVRGWLFHQARQRMHSGDWFLRVDADEFHHIAPPEFVRTRICRHETAAYHQYYDFRLTASEVKAWETGQETLADRQKPIEERRRWFTPSAYSEPRLCRYRDTMQWPPSVSFPFNAGFVARERLPIRHYPHRDPVQLDRRCRLRAVMMADQQNRSNWSHPERHHWATQDWRRFVAPDDLPGLRYWLPGTDLPEFPCTNHLKAPHLRLIQRTIHGWLLPLLDRTRSRWSETATPQPISAEVLNRLREQLAETSTRRESLNEPIAKNGEHTQQGTEPCESPHR